MNRRPDCSQEQMLKAQKYYILDLDTRTIAIDEEFDTFSAAIAAERAKGRTERYTALRGDRIMRHLDVWCLPLTLEEAEADYFRRLEDGTFYEMKPTKGGNHANTD